MNPLDHQHAIFFLDFTHGLAYKAVDRSGNLTRLQRASKGAGQSTGSRGHDVVERCGVGWKGIRRHFIVIRDRPVHAKQHGRRFRGQVRAPHGSLFALDAHFGAIDHIRHFATISL